ncbi:hypothetical protein AYO38_07600 [bacterium SCGC AG-212-C10]|nr:hypothetical protein AYO38_07600 [bacterium SCGC AG-212-C10]
MPNRPQPHFPEWDTKHYWDGVKEGELRYQTCDTCSQVNFTPSAHCKNCGNNKLTWKVSKGEGTVYTFSVVRQNRIPGFVELGAYAVAYVDLDEGFRMLTNIVGTADPTKDVKIGQRVKVEYEAQDSGDYPVPVFRPV